MVCRRGGCSLLVSLGEDFEGESYVELVKGLDLSLTTEMFMLL